MKKMRLITLIMLLFLIRLTQGAYNWNIECVHCPTIGSGDLDITHDTYAYDEENDVCYFLISGDSLHLAKWSPGGWELENIVDTKVINCEIKLINSGDIHIIYFDWYTYDLYYTHYNGSS